jgi:hypothetical protein
MSIVALFCSVDDFWQRFEPLLELDLLASGQRRRRRATRLHPAWSTLQRGAGAVEVDELTSEQVASERLDPSGVGCSAALPGRISLPPRAGQTKRRYFTAASFGRFR